MAYKKLEKFTKQNETAKTFLNEGMNFEAWITYIREADKDPQTIVDDIDQECNLKKSLLTEEEKEALQFEAMDHMIMRRN